MINKITHTLDKFGFGWLSPLVRLCAGDSPREQITPVIRFILMPVLAIVAFLVVWGQLATNVKTNLGTVPGPAAVWDQARYLWDDYRSESEREAAYYVQQEERRAGFQERFPDREFRERPYSGRDTYVDQIVTSLKTVFTGFLIASAVAIPIGILCGLSPTFYNALNPLIQVFKPVSPLAWLPIVMILVAALYTPDDPLFERAFLSSAIVVALCSLWPTLINTAVGVQSIDRDHLNVARVLKLNAYTKVRKIVIPSSLPYIFTGLRLSLGVGWMVLIAAEMLAQNPGLGKFVWDMYQSSSSETLALIMVAVFTIGILGFALDRIMFVLERFVTYDTGQ